MVLTSFEDNLEDASVIAGLFRSDGILRYSSGVNPNVSVIIAEERVAVTFPVPSTKMTYRVCHGFRLRKQDDYFRVNLNLF